MNASLLAVTPAPASTQKTPSQSAGATDEASSPFASFLSASINPDEKNRIEAEPLEPDSSASNSLEMFMVAEQPSLSFAASPALNSGQLAAGKNITTTLTTINDALPPIPFSSDELTQFQTMPASTGQTIESLVPKTTGKQPASPLNSAETLLTQQLQTILAGDSQAAPAIRSSYHSAPAETLNGLSSPHIQSADSAVIASILPAQTAMQEGAGDHRTKTTETGESIRQNVEGQYLSAKLDGPADKNNAGNQRQESGQQENSAGQPNTANVVVTASLGNNDQTGHSFATALGAQASAPTLGAAPAANASSLSPRAPIAAEEVINNLIERFSINPRLQTSKISLNLNPAELGALKIDILVKGDSIKAHIAVNSQQIQEIIEKNMPRLRAILEQQGFNIEDFQVSMESTTSDSNHFFQQQFSSRQDAAPQTTLAADDASFDLSLSSAEEFLSASLDAGINLSI